MQTTPNLGLELFAPLGVGWREDATAGALLDFNMMLLDAAVGHGGSSVSVNGSTVTNPNFVNSASVTFSVTGSSVSATATVVGGVSSVNSKTGAVVLSYSDVGADAVGAAATALSSAKSYADSLAPNYDASGAAATAQSTSEAYAYALVSALVLPSTKAASSHEWLASYDASTGAFTQAQPAAADLSDSASSAGYVLRANGTSFVSAQLGYSDLSGTPTLAATTSRTSHSFFSSYNASTGAFGQKQPTVADLSDIPSANTVLAGPTSGAAATATFRVLVSADIPNNAANTSGTASNLSGTPALPNGTTATTQTALSADTKLATDAYCDSAVAVETSRAETAEALLAPLASPTFTGTVTLPSGQALVAPALGTPASGTLTNCTFPTLNQNTTGSAGSVAAANVTVGTFASGMTLVAPVLGPPASGTLTNCTFPTLNQNTTGTAGGLSGTPSITVNAVSATTINGSTLSGTFSGNATLSGNLTFTGTETSNNTCSLTTTTAATAAGTVGASPLQQWNGTYWTSGASTTDTWSAKNSIATPATCTISNVAETAGNVVTLTVSGVTGFTAGAAGTTVTFSGLTTATWLNGQNVTLTTASGTTMTFTDPTSHGTQASHAEAGTVTQNNPAATLVLAHSGSATAQIQIPATNAQSNSPTMCAVGTTTTGISLGSTTPSPLQIYAIGSAAPIQFFNSGVLHGTINNQQTAGDFLFVGQQATTGIGTNGMGATNTFPVCSIGMSAGSSWSSTTSGSNLMGVNIGTKVNQTGDDSLWMAWTPPYGSSNFQTVSVSPTINQSSVTNTVAGSALVSNVGAVVFSTANAYTSASCLAQVSVGTNTALNGTQTLTAQAQRAGSPYTITNSIENSSSVVTLTIGTHSIVANDWVTVTGLTTETWLNGQTVKVSSVVANTSITFTDLTTHGTQATHSDTGTVACNYVTFALTHANITGSADTGTVLEQSTGLYTGILVNPTETATAPGLHMLYDAQVGGTRVWGITNKGHEIVGSANNDRAGAITSASGTTVSKTYSVNYGSTPVVVVTPTTNAGAFYLSASSTSGFTITYATSGAQTFNYIVIGNPN